MNDIVNNFLLAGDKFITEMHLRQTGFTYSPCRVFTKNNKRMQKQIQDICKWKFTIIYQKELDKACCQHDIACGGFKDLTRKKASDKILCDKAFNIAKSPKYDGYQRGLALMVYTFFDEKNSGRTVKNENVSNKELAE